jgi:sialic acid synthase SpsE
VQRYKVASRSINDCELIAAIAATGKPMIVSLGMWHGSGFPNIVSIGGVDFLYVSRNTRRRSRSSSLASVDFEKYSGFSDHSEGITAACASFALGSRILEKHLTMDKAAFGPDHSSSMTPSELAAINQFRNDWALLR